MVNDKIIFFSIGEKFCTRQLFAQQCIVHLAYITELSILHLEQCFLKGGPWTLWGQQKVPSGQQANLNKKQNIK